MGKVIRVTETKVWQYEPNLKADIYAENQVQTLDEAMELDKKDYQTGGINLDELATDFPEVVNVIWEIVDDYI